MQSIYAFYLYLKLNEKLEVGGVNKCDAAVSVLTDLLLALEDVTLDQALVRVLEMEKNFNRELVSQVILTIDITPGMVWSTIGYYGAAIIIGHGRNFCWSSTICSLLIHNPFY